MLKTYEVSLVNLGYGSVKVIQGRLPKGTFHAIAIGEASKVITMRYTDAPTKLGKSRKTISAGTGLLFPELMTSS